MRFLTVPMVVAAIAALMLSGCKSGGSGATTNTQVDREAGLANFEDNPTSYDRRGEPSLDELSRPAAWVYIDGKEGRYQERDGKKLMEWFISSPVSPSPTFRVRAYEPLLGVPTDFSCALQTVSANDGSHISYAIAAKDGTFKVGHDYSLTNPGSDFTIRLPATEKIFDSIKPLAPGDYIIVAKIRNAKKNADGLAVTRFTVAAPKPDAAASATAN